jgi:hypothetical protein
LKAVEANNKANEITTYLTPRSYTLLEKPPVAQLLKNFPIFYGTRKYITVITRVPC